MVQDAKAAAALVVDGHADALLALSHRIHAEPELKFEEEKASRWCAEALAEGGFEVETGICDLPTAFSATAGDGPLTLAVCCEYDALPSIGHACGHNVIAAAAVGAGLALRGLVDDLGLTVKVLGTPAEEGGGGKILMLERGGFAGVDAAMMVHPAPFETDNMSCLAVSQVEVHYHGKEAHASAFPELGVNAADALTVAQTAIGLLRQHIPPTARVHGIVTRGGDAPNVVPGHTVGNWFVRERTIAELAELEPRIQACFEAGAVATGCELRLVHPSPVYSEFRPDAGMTAFYRRNAEALGRRFDDDDPRARVVGSTDMANVSLAMPAIHPMLGLGCWPVSNHQPAFAAFAKTPVADRAVLDGAVGMAWTCIDLAGDEPSRRRLLTARAG